MGLISGRGTKIPHATEQLNPHIATNEPLCCSEYPACYTKMQPKNKFTKFQIEKKHDNFLSVPVRCVLHVSATVCAECIHYEHLHYEHSAWNCGDRLVPAFSESP